MSNPKILLNSKEIRELIDGSERLECHWYGSAFGEKASQEANEGWQLLQQIFNFHFNAHNATEPFGPMVVSEGGRSTIPHDLTDAQLDAIARTLDIVDDSEYRARISDVLWLRRRDPNAARTAIDAYLATGARLEDPQHWTASMERYERALRLARQIEPKGDLPRKVLAHLETRVRYYDGTDPKYFTYKALGLLEEFRFGDFAGLAEIAGRMAAQAHADSDFRRARSHHEIQAKLFRRANDVASAEAAQVSCAECFIDEAEAREAGGSFMAAHSFWQDAITACRDRPSMRRRIPELQKRLAVAGNRMRDEMQSISQEIDLREQAEKTIKTFTGLAWDDAFFTLITFVPMQDYSRLRDLSVKQIDEHPLQAMMSVDIIDAAGRKVGVRPPAISDDLEQYETALTGFVEQNAEISRELTAQGFLIPAIQQILEDHKIEENSLEVIYDW